MCLLVCVCVSVRVDTSTALENGEQEAHGVQKPGKPYPTIPSAVYLVIFHPPITALFLVFQPPPFPHVGCLWARALVVLLLCFQRRT